MDIRIAQLRARAAEIERAASKLRDDAAKKQVIMQTEFVDIAISKEDTSRDDDEDTVFLSARPMNGEDMNLNTFYSNLRNIPITVWRTSTVLESTRVSAVVTQQRKFGSGVQDAKANIDKKEARERMERVDDR